MRLKWPFSCLFMFSLSRSLCLSVPPPFPPLPHPLSFPYLAILITSQRVSELVFISPCHFWLCGFLPLSRPVCTLSPVCKWHNQLWLTRACVCAFAELSSPVPNLKEGGLIFDIGMKGWFVIIAGPTADQPTRGWAIENGGIVSQYLKSFKQS